MQTLRLSCSAYFSVSVLVRPQRTWLNTLETLRHYYRVSHLRKDKQFLCFFISFFSLGRRACARRVCPTHPHSSQYRSTTAVSYEIPYFTSHIYLTSLASVSKLFLHNTFPPHERQVYYTPNHTNPLPVTTLISHVYLMRSFLT